MQIFVTGCWSRHELNDLAIAVGIGIDKTGDQYQVSAQVVYPVKSLDQRGQTDWLANSRRIKSV
jgi:spore germination protein KC